MEVNFFKKTKVGPRNQGFTLIETLIAMVVLLVIIFGFYEFLKNLSDSSIRTNSSLLSQNQIKQTLEIMVPEIRSMAQSNIGGYPIESASTSTLVFYSDIDHDLYFERVKYYLNGTSFEKSVIKPSGSPLTYATSSEKIYNLVDNIVIGSQIFSYYDALATSTSAASMSLPINILKVRMIDIRLTANKGSTQLPSLVGGHNQATIRNLRYE